MVDIVFLTLAILASTGCSLLILRKAGARLTVPTAIMIFVGLYILLNCIGGPWLFSGTIRRWRWLPGDSILTAIALSQASLLVLSLTILFWSRFSWVSEPHRAGFSAAALTERGKIAMLIALGGSLAALGLYLSMLPGLPMLAVLQGQLLQGAFLRSEATNNFSGSFASYAFVFEDVLPFLSCVFFANWLITKKRFDLALAAIGLLSALLVPIVLITKGGMFEALIMIFSTYFLTRNKPVSPKVILFAVAIVGGLLLSLFYVTLGGGTFTLDRVGETVMERIFVGNLAPASVYVNTFPAKLPYLLGASFPNPGGILPHIPIELNKIGYSYVFEFQQLNTAIAGTAAAVFWTDGYANFGILGALASGFVVATMLYFTSSLALRLFQGSVVKIGMTVWIGTHLGKMAQTFFMPFLADTNLVKMFAIAFLIYAVDRQFKIRRLAPSVAPAI